MDTDKLNKIKYFMDAVKKGTVKLEEVDGKVIPRVAVDLEHFYRLGGFFLSSKLNSKLHDFTEELCEFLDDRKARSYSLEEIENMPDDNMREYYLEEYFNHIADESIPSLEEKFGARYRSLVKEIEQECLPMVDELPMPTINNQSQLLNCQTVMIMRDLLKSGAIKLEEVDGRVIPRVVIKGQMDSIENACSCLLSNELQSRVYDFAEEVSYAYQCEEDMPYSLEQIRAIKDDNAREYYLEEYNNALPYEGEKSSIEEEYGDQFRSLVKEMEQRYQVILYLYPTIVKDSGIENKKLTHYQEKAMKMVEKERTTASREVVDR